MSTKVASGCGPDVALGVCWCGAIAEASLASGNGPPGPQAVDQARSAARGQHPRDRCSCAARCRGYRGRRRRRRPAPRALRRGAPPLRYADVVVVDAGPAGPPVHPVGAGAVPTDLGLGLAPASPRVTAECAGPLACPRPGGGAAAGGLDISRVDHVRARAAAAAADFAADRGVRGPAVGRRRLRPGPSAGEELPGGVG